MSVRGFASEAEPREKTGARQTSIYDAAQWPHRPCNPLCSVEASGKRVLHIVNEPFNYAGL